MLQVFESLKLSIVATSNKEARSKEKKSHVTLSQVLTH